MNKTELIAAVAESAGKKQSRSQRDSGRFDCTDRQNR